MASFFQATIQVVFKVIRQVLTMMMNPIQLSKRLCFGSTEARREKDSQLRKSLRLGDSPSFACQKWNTLRSCMRFPAEASCLHHWALFYWNDDICNDIVNKIKDEYDIRIRLEEQKNTLQIYKTMCSNDFILVKGLIPKAENMPESVYFQLNTENISDVTNHIYKNRNNYGFILTKLDQRYDIFSTNQSKVNLSKRSQSQKSFAYSFTANNDEIQRSTEVPIEDECLCRRSRSNQMKSNLKSCNYEVQELIQTSSTPKKVRFNLQPEIHVMRTWNFAYRSARKGNWEEIARDRDRFKRRIERAAEYLNPILDAEHRRNIYNSRFRVKKKKKKQRKRKLKKKYKLNKK